MGFTTCKMDDRIKGQMKQFTCRFYALNVINHMDDKIIIFIKKKWSFNLGWSQPLPDR